MDSNTNILYSAAGLPALISTGITFIYFLLKACHYLVHAISHKTEGRVATATPGCGEQKYSADTGIQGHTEVHKQISRNTTEQYGGGTQRSSGSVFVPGRRQDIRLPSHGDASEYKNEPTFRQNAKRLQGGKYRDSQEYHGKGPVTHILSPQEYLQKVEAGTMPPMDNHLMMKQMAESVTLNNQTKFMMMEFRDIERPAPPKTPQPPKCK